jgi:hypothetical protein
VYKVNNEYWIEKITIHTIVGYVFTLFGASGMGTYAYFFSLAYLVSFIWILAGKDKHDIMICLCCLLIPVGTLSVGVLASIIVRPVFVIRYIIPSVSLLVLFMAIVLGKTDNSILLSVLLTVVLMGGISNYGVRLYSEYRTLHNYLPIDEYDDIDAYVVIDPSLHIAETLAYYDTKTSIYCGDNISNANPYPNRMKIGDFDTENVDKAILLLGGEETIPDEYNYFYDIEYIGQWKCEYDADAYLMVKK